MVWAVVVGASLTSQHKKTMDIIMFSMIWAAVQLLLIEAIDAESLCMLYHGWAPWSWL